MIRGAAWPEADALFRKDPRWLGGDDGYSVPLGPGRTLWLFGDTFIGDGAGPDRARAHFVRNSIGIMTGTDPASATIAFAWGDDPGSPFFDVPAPDWLWPLDGTRIGDRLLLFFMLVRPAQADGTGGIEDWRAHGPLGFFDVSGWTAILVDNPDDDPVSWRWSLAAPLVPAAIVLGAAVLHDGARIYLYGWDAARRIVVGRLTPDQAARAAFAEIEWWCGDAWASHGAPTPIIEDGTTEFTVHRRSPAALCMTAAHGVAPGSIVLRAAPAPEGPWSEPARAFTPTVRPGAFAYAGKAHPHLAGADLVATYASIASADVTLQDHDLYYPRFARLTFEDPG